MAGTSDTIEHGIMSRLELWRSRVFLCSTLRVGILAVMRLVSWIKSILGTHTESQGCEPQASCTPSYFPNIDRFSLPKKPVFESPSTDRSASDSPLGEWCSSLFCVLDSCFCFACDVDFAPSNEENETKSQKKNLRITSEINKKTIIRDVIMEKDVCFPRKHC